jgi:hypothetical protein
MLWPWLLDMVVIVNYDNTAACKDKYDISRDRFAQGCASWVDFASDLSTEYISMREHGWPVVVGAVTRGWLPCYSGLGSGNTPNDIGAQLDVAYNNNVDFIVLVTWNDYSEGTQFEPSYMRLRDHDCRQLCLDNQYSP